MRGGVETILVVEDEDAVRRLAVQILENAGYRVLNADNGERAIEVFAQHSDEIDLLLLDAIMPGGNGKDVFAHVRKTHQTPVLFTSGYSASSLPDNFLHEHNLEVLAKPYSPEVLLCKIREKLDAFS